MNAAFNMTRDDLSIQRNVMRPSLSKEAAIRRDRQLAALQRGVEAIAGRAIWILVAVVSAWDIAVTFGRQHELVARLF